MRNSKKTKKEGILKAVDFFCGAGGVTCGFRQAGIEVIAGIDIDQTCKKTYERNNKGAKFIHADVAILQPMELENQLSIQPNTDNLIFVGCSPCQYYTVINTEKEKSAKGKLLLEEFRRFIDHFRPGYILIENVPGIETKVESPLSSFKDFITAIGYVCDAQVINAAGYNVPQNRRRYVLIATRVNKEIAIPSASKKIYTVRKTIGKFPKVPPGHKDDSYKKHWTAGLEDICIKRLEATPIDGGTRIAWKDIEALQLKCYKGKDDIFKDVYGRMYWDQPAPTITTKFHSISNGRFGHPEQTRALSIREGASLQSFPKTYRFYSDTLASAARMIGNAVPPKMAKKIGQSLINNYLNGTV